MAIFVTKAVSKGDAASAWSLIDQDAPVRLFGRWAAGAALVRVAAGRQRTWKVGRVSIDHRVKARPSGCAVEVELRGPAPLVYAYGPVVAVRNRNLARAAGRA